MLLLVANLAVMTQFNVLGGTLLIPEITRKRNVISNAPEFIKVYCSSDSFQLMEYAFEWRYS
jgi:hypothetical protein